MHGEHDEWVRLLYMCFGLVLIQAHQTFPSRNARDGINTLRIVPLTELDNRTFRADKRVRKVSRLDSGGIQDTIRHIGAHQNGVLEDGIAHDGALDAGVAHVGAGEVGLAELGLEEAGVGEVAAGKVAGAEEAAGEVLAGVRAVEGLAGPVLRGVVLAAAGHGRGRRQREGGGRGERGRGVGEAIAVEAAGRCTRVVRGFGSGWRVW